MQQRTAEQIEDVPQFRDETFDAVALVLRERVQQRTRVQVVELLQSPGEAVDALMLVPRERGQQRSAEQMVMWPQPSRWSGEEPSSEEVEREMRVQEALWDAKAPRRRVLPKRCQRWH